MRRRSSVTGGDGIGVTWAIGNINDLCSIEGMADTGARRGLFEGGLLKSISDDCIHKMWMWMLRCLHG